ncbi:hypothetical protein ACIF83_35700 [Streptomyces sp. NPDC085866]|uniref:hypothetical protein n=1 Tax=Streptomyces sp. NPDC085866 TaxID=3365736 RepID=UPI0037D81368
MLRGVFGCLRGWAPGGGVGLLGRVPVVRVRHHTTLPVVTRTGSGRRKRERAVAL